MARVAGPLEPVDLQRLEWVGRRELIDDEQPAAPPGDPCELREHPLRMRDMVEGPQRCSEVERLVVERKGGRISLHELDVAELRRALATEREQLGNGVDADHLADDRRQGDREGSRRGSGVERTVAARREQE